VNLTKDYEHEQDGQPTGAFFGHSGFNSGYLTTMFGSKRGGILEQLAEPWLPLPIMTASQA
jgi:hypothetical protein